MKDQEITMTDEDFREWHYKLWDWLAATGESNKDSFLKFQELNALSDISELSYPVWEALNSYCFACGANELNREEKGACGNCPIDWGDDCEDCVDDNSPFIKWEDGATAENRKHYAKLISQLPWRGKERDE